MAGKPAQERPDRLIASLLSNARHSIASRRKLLDAGLSADQIDDRLASGLLQPLYRGVYAVGSRRVTREARWMAATQACRGAALSHLDAAALWGFLSPQSGAVHLTTASRAGRDKRPGLVVHRTPLGARDRTRRRDIPVTTPARTLIDIAPLIARRRLERALDEAKYLGLLTDRALTDTLARNSRRHGVRPLKRVLSQHCPGATRTRSGLEERFLALCRANGLPQPELNVELEGIEVDFVWSEARLAVETDTYATHGGAAAFERDHRRDLRLRAAGWIPLRFTDRQLDDEPELVVASLRRELG
jgi:very-short-patch-repair endonuclease